MLKKTSISHAIKGTFSIIFICIFSCGLYLVTAIDNVRGQLENVVNKNIQLLALASELQLYTLSYRRFALDYGLTIDDQEHKKIIQDIRSNDENVSKTQTTISKLSDTEYLEKVTNDYNEKIKEYREMQNNYIKLIDIGNIDMARKTILGPMLDPFNEIMEMISDLQNHLKKDAVLIENQETQHIENLIISTILCGSLLLLFLVVAAISITRKVTLPLSRLNLQMEKVAKGDLSTKLHIEDFSQDEVGIAVKNFTNMQNSLANLVKEITESAKALDKTALSFNEQLSETASNLTIQKQEIAMIASATEQMQSGLSVVVDNTNQASDSASLARVEADNTYQSVNLSITQNKKLSMAIIEAASVIKQLGEDSQAISSISDVISSIADQTNLLALNAAIEAARAGESGRGFAVVADEVRQLAQKTQTSIEQINQTITTLQGNATKAEKVMNASQQQMQMGLEKTLEAGASIQTILNSTNQIADMNAQIAAASEQQSVAANSLAKSVHNIHSASSRIHDGAQLAKEASKTLSDESQHLNILARRFSL